MVLKREEPRIRTEYHYRRRLEAKEMLPAVGVGLGVGAVAFYVAYVLLQRTPLDPRSIPAETPSGRPRLGTRD